MNNFDDLFLQAREISDLDARAAFLDEACAHQPELRARLDSLLADASAADAFFGEDDTVERVSQLVSPQDQDGTSRETRFTPTHIGPYRILERIGHGGMGDVFRAVQKEPIRREVALKLIKLGMDTQQVIARFEAERQALALMDHPHIARVLDAGADDLGHPYFVMELVRGVPITQYADEKQLTLRERLALMQQVCQAIQHAHSKGVIHRDLKPSNILVSTQDGRPHAKVIDFGIAKATAQPLTDKTLFTQFQQFIGTPQYMSPEQAEGSLDIDTRADVYALGILLYELLTGGTPVEAATLRQAALHEIARIIKEQDTPKPSTRLLSVAAPARAWKAPEKAPPVAAPARAWSPDAPTPKPHVLADAATPTTLSDLAKARSISAEALIKTVRGELDWLVMKALEKDRARRYETPNQLSDDIARYLEGQPIVAAPPSSTYRMKKFIRKHRAPVLAAASVLTLMTAGILGTSWGLVREKAAKEEATQQAKIAEQERTRAEAEKAEAQKQKTEADQQRLTAETAKTTAEREREAAELESYIGNLAAAQAALTAHDYPGARARLAVCPEKLRGWEWRFLRAKAESVFCWLASHLHLISFCNQGRELLLFNDALGVVTRHDLEGNPTGVSIKLPDDFSHRNLTLTKNSKHIIYSVPLSESGTGRGVVIWNLSTGQKHSEINISSDSRLQFEVSDDGNWLLLSPLPRLYRIDGTYVDLKLGKDEYPLCLQPGHNRVLAVRAQKVGTRSEDVFADERDLWTEARLWNFDGTPASEPMLHQRCGRHHEWSQDGKRLLIETENNGVTLWDGNGVRLNYLPEAANYRMLPDGTILAQKNSDTWDVVRPEGRITHSFTFSNSTSERIRSGWLFEDVSSTGFILRELRDGTSIALRDERTWYCPTKWPLKFELPRRKPYARGDGLRHSSLSSDGSHILDVDNDGIVLLDTGGYEVSERIDVKLADDFGVKFLSSGDVVCMTFEEGIGGRSTGSVVCSLTSFGSAITKLYPQPLQFDKDGNWLSGPEAKNLDDPIFKLKLAAITGQTPPGQNETNALEIETAERGHSLIWMPHMNGELKKVFTAKIPEVVTAACYDAKNTRMFVATGAYVIVWDVNRAREIMRLPASLVKSLRTCRDGDQLVIQSVSGDTEIWDARAVNERRKSILPNAEQLAQSRELVEELLSKDLSAKRYLWAITAPEAAQFLEGKTDLHPLVRQRSLREFDLALRNREVEAGRAGERWFYRKHADRDLDQKLRALGYLTCEDSVQSFNYERRERPSNANLLSFISGEKRRRHENVAAAFGGTAPPRTPISADEAEELEAARALVSPNDLRIVDAWLKFASTGDPVAQQELRTLLDETKEISTELWPMLAFFYAESGRVSEAQHCINQSIQVGVEVYGGDLNWDGSKSTPEKRSYLIRDSKGDVIQAPEGYQPKGDSKPLPEHSWDLIRQTMEILKKAKTGKP